MNTVYASEYFFQNWKTLVSYQVKWVNILVTCWKSLKECTRPRKNDSENIWLCPGAGARTRTPTETATRHNMQSVISNIVIDTCLDRVSDCWVWAVCQHQDISVWEFLWRSKVRIDTGCPKKSVILVDMAITPLKYIRNGKSWCVSENLSASG